MIKLGQIKAVISEVTESELKYKNCNACIYFEILVLGSRSFS